MSLLPGVRLGPYEVLAPLGRYRTLWISPLAGGSPEPVFEFENPDVRIDYPVWSPDGRWVLFDRLSPQGGDVWLMERLE